MTKIKARNYKKQKGLDRKSITKKKKKYNLRISGGSASGGGSSRTQKGGSSLVFDSRFKGRDVQKEFGAVKGFYQERIIPKLSGAAVAENYLAEGPGFKKVNTAGLEFTLKNPFAGADEDLDKGVANFQAMTRENMAYFKNDSIRREISHVMIHGNLFGQGESYFQVPPNIVICILPEINYYASIYQTNRIFRKYGGIDNENLFDDIFAYLAQMTQGEEFKFKNLDKNIAGLELPDYLCSNTFRNSNWFYPGQFCYNISLSASANKYKKQLLDVVDIYETFDRKEGGGEGGVRGDGGDGGKVPEKLSINQI